MTSGLLAISSQASGSVVTGTPVVLTNEWRAVFTWLTFFAGVKWPVRNFENHPNHERQF